jgi:filamin
MTFFEFVFPSLSSVGTSPFDMTACVTSPTGQSELCEIKDLDDCHYSIKFVPKEMGVHTVSVKHKEQHIPGSPFQFTVGPITEGGAHKVHAGGPGLENGEVTQPGKALPWLSLEAGEIRPLLIAGYFFFLLFFILIF